MSFHFFSVQRFSALPHEARRKLETVLPALSLSLLLWSSLVCSLERRVVMTLAFAVRACVRLSPAYTIVSFVVSRGFEGFSEL